MGSIADAALERAEAFLSLAPSASMARYRRLAERAAAGSYPAAVKLHCIDCCGWSYPEAARCEISTCALYTLNRRIFASRSRAAATTAEPEPVPLAAGAEAVS